MLIQPAELLYNSLVQEGNDCQAAAEHKRASLGKE
jgi:hypothetical protein